MTRRERTFLKIALIAALVLLLFFIAVRSASHQATPQSSPEHHALTWREYDGLGDPAKALYVFDETVLGRGEAGLSALRKEIRTMPRSSVIEILPYYGDPGAEQARTYPFDRKALADYAWQHGVTVSVPSSQ